MALGIMYLGIHGVAGIVIFNLRNDLDDYATDYTYILNSELCLLTSACVYTSFSEMEAGTIESGTGTEFAFQCIGQIGHSVGLD